MISETQSFINIFNLMYKFELSSSLTRGIGPLEAEYIAKHAVYYFVEKEDEEEFDDLTEEELRIMNMHDKGYSRWYGEKYIDTILLGDDDE